MTSTQTPKYRQKDVKQSRQREQWELRVAHPTHLLVNCPKLATKKSDKRRIGKET